MAAIPRTSDFERILALPRRIWDENSQEIAVAATRVLRTEYGNQTLRPVQAQCLMEAAENGGLFAPIPVGGGKTLISLLLPTAMGAKRPILVIPAGLKGKTDRERMSLSYQWRIQQGIRVITYESLSRVGQAQLLEQYRPDLVVCDEVHYIKNRKAAVTRRILRYLHDHQDVQFCGMSGTITKRSIADYHHIILYSHKRRCPLPLTYLEGTDWADALDNRPVLQRPAPGALLELPHSNPQAPPLARAREGYRKRLTETVGVITLSEDRISCSLRLAVQKLPLSRVVRELLNTLQGTWELPDGHALTDPMAVWRHGRELLMGFYYRWNPRPPLGWLNARKSWGTFVREILKHSRTLDSEMQVALAHPQQPELLAWRAVRDTFKPATEAVWVDDTVLQYATGWLKEAGICWVEHIAFGTRLAQMSGVEFFAQRDGIERAGDSVIASVESNCEGKNLQRWSRNLVVSVSPNGRILEQLIGRTHRFGQEADEVTVAFLDCDTSHVEALEKAKADALYIQQSTGQQQKILYGDWT